MASAFVPLTELVLVSSDLKSVADTTMNAARAMLVVTRLLEKIIALISKKCRFRPSGPFLQIPNVALFWQEILSNNKLNFLCLHSRIPKLKAPASHFTSRSLPGYAPWTTARSALRARYTKVEGFPRPSAGKEGVEDPVAHFS